MYPTLFEAPGGVGVHPYGLLILAAFCAAFGLVHWRSIQIGFHPDKLIGVYIASAVGGMLGGRLLYALAVEPTKTLSNPASLFAFSGFAFYGGLIGGTLGVAAVSKGMKLDTWKMADTAAPAVLVAYGIGRLGCFFAGCCHGVIVDLAPDGLIPLLPEGMLHGQVFWTSQYPFVVNRFDAGVGLLHHNLYPTQLWSVVVGCGLGAALLYSWKFRRFDGQLAATALLLEPPTRFLIEGYRSDERGYVATFPVNATLQHWMPGLAQAGDAGGPPIMGITTSQAIALGAMVLGLAIYLFRWNAGVAPEVAVEEDPEGLPA